MNQKQNFNCFSIISYNKFALGFACFMPFFISILLFLAKNIIVIISSLCVCMALYFLSHEVLKFLFTDCLCLCDGKVVCKEARIHGSSKKEYIRADISQVLIENESFTSGPGSRNTIYFIIKESKKIAIFNNRIAGFFSINEAILRDFASILGVPIKREYFVLSSDLKNRSKRL